MRYADAFDRIDRLSGTTSRLFNAYINAPERSPQLLERVLMALELRWRMEDLVLIPALESTQGVMEGRTQDATRELGALRELVALAKNDGLSIDAQRLLLHAMETLAALRAERINQALTRAQRAAIVDARALGRELEDLFDLVQASGPEQQPSLEALLFESATPVGHSH